MIGLLQRLLDAFVRFAMELAAALTRGILGTPRAALHRVREVSTPELRACDEMSVLDELADLSAPRHEAAPGARHWVADHRGQAVGVVSLREGTTSDGGPRGLELYGMAVLPEWRGRGLGDELLCAVAHAVGQGDPKAEAWSDVDERAVPLFERQGWALAPPGCSEPEPQPGHVRMRRGADGSPLLVAERS